MRITGRQLRRIIQEEVARMINEEDAPSIMPSSFGTVTPTPVKMPGAGTMPSVTRSQIDIQSIRGAILGDVTEAQANLEKTLAAVSAGSIDASRIPLVAALETDSMLAGRTGREHVVPDTYNEGVITATVTLIKVPRGSGAYPRSGSVYVKINKVDSATFDGRQSRDAVYHLNTNPELNYALVDMSSERLPFGATDELKPNAKFTIVTSSRPHDDRKDGPGVYGRDGANQFRVVTVKSIKVQPLA